MRRSAGVVLGCALGVLACGGDDSAGEDGEPDAATRPPDMQSDAGSGDAGVIAGPETCNLSGIWIARQNAESIAAGQPQYANTWYYYELTQRGTELEVTRHMDCGLEVLGTVNVVVTPATTNALRVHNLQVGRKGTVTPQSDGTCALALERFWSVRGVSEARYLPTPRSRDATLAQLQTELPLPPASMPAATEDWDGDGKPGIGWIVSGIVQGERHTAQRDWTRYFSAPGYTLRAASDFREDVVVRAEFSVEEIVYDSSPGLNQVSQPNAAAAHTLTMRFLGRTRDDARASMVSGDDAVTCANVRSALPPTRALR